MTPNAEIDYVDADTGELIETIQFYDPGLDENSWLAKEEKRNKNWNGPHLAYGYGRPISPK
jgi:hypothetical protein